jgi:hypothetical protein
VAQYSRDELLALHEHMQDPVWFAENVVGVKPWSRQAVFLRSVRHNARVSHRSGHKVSKSNSMALLALWWVVTQPDARAAITSASFHQVEKIIWREVRLMHQRSRLPIGGMLYRDPSSGLQLPSGNEIFGFSTNEPERAAGISSPNLLYLIDEASGVPPEIFEAIEGNRAAGAKIVLCSNPTRTVGEFFETHTTKRRFWTTIHTPSTLSPNVTGEAVIPGLATPAWIEEKKREWGEDSPMYQVRVMGNFPGQGSDAIIGLALVMEARQAWAKTADEGALRLGVDPARYGDDESIIQVVRGLKAYPAIVFSGQLDGQRLAGHVMDAVQQFRRKTDEKVRVKIDSIGLGASPQDFLDHLDRAHLLGIEAVPVNVSETAPKSDTYSNLRSQLCFDLKEWLEAGGAIPEDELLTQEMVSPTYEFDVKGRRKLRPKDYERKILGRSPDRRNALELAIFEPRPRQSIGGGYIWM